MINKSGWRKFSSSEGEEIWEDSNEPNPWYNSTIEVNSVDLYTSCNRYKLELGFGSYNMSSDYAQSASSGEVKVLRRRVYRVLKEVDVGKEVTVEADEMVIMPKKPGQDKHDIFSSYLVRMNHVRRQTEFVLFTITEEHIGQSLVVAVDYLQPDYPQIRIGYD